MKTKNTLSLIILLAFLHFTVKTSAQTIQYQGNITTDTTWVADTIEITGNVIIDSNVTLTIQPGTFVHILGYYSIWSYGSIQAIGTETDSIIFTHLDTINHNDTSTIAGGWHGIRLLQRSSPDTSIFRYCEISNGKAVVPGMYSANHEPENQGGNIYGDNFGSIILSNCKILNGRVKSDGGGVYLENGDYISIDNCSFLFNHSYYDIGGGAFISKVINVSVTNSLFYFNECYNFDAIGEGGQGAGIGIQFSLGYDAFALIENNRFFNNKGGTGTIYESYQNSIVTGNIICNNYGCGIWNAHFSNNTTYSNNTIINNVGSIYSGIVTASTNIKLINNIIRNNYAYPNYPVDQIWHPDAVPAPDVSYCNVEFGYEGEGNFDDKPYFVNPTEGIGQSFDALEADWTLLDNSSNINAGIPDTLGFYLPELDIYGNPRFFGNRIDIGAYENQYIWVKINDSPIFNNSIRVYPNPGKDKIHIELQPGMEGAWIQLVDCTGKQIIQSQITTIPALFSPTGLKPGIYFYRIYNHNTVFKTGKWINI